MQNLEQKKLESLSQEELIEALNNSKMEMFKYVNKFLEVEEKWAFTNIFLKKLNSIRQKNELCSAICEGFLKLTDSKVCFFCIFNQDNSKIEFKKIAFSENVCDEKLTVFINSINAKCAKFIEQSVDIQKIDSYFNQISGKELIILSITYAKAFLGYLMLIKEDKNFYNDNINFINIFPEHISLILENISLYQESEKQNKRKMEFLAGIAHEFKTPLNAIIGFAEMLQEKAQNLKHLDSLKYIVNILQGSRHLLSLIEDIIDVSKSQYKSMELNYTVFSPRDEIIKILQTLEKMFEEKNIELNYTLSYVKISADIKRFRQLIYNLVSNAIKFNEQNGKVTVFTYVTNEHFFFEITDTGDGISKKNYDKIFNFFSQVNRSQLKRQSGSGVGLALCKRIIDAHGGNISFSSQIKKGSTFWFDLPITKG
jgi:signal transduction histidine kinase